MKHDETMHALRVADRLIAEEERGLASDRVLLGIAKSFRKDLLSDDPVQRRKAIDAALDHVRIVVDEIRPILRPEWQDLLQPMKGSPAPV